MPKSYPQGIPEGTPQGIPEEILSPSEYNLLSTALLTAEHGPLALSTYLTSTPSSNPDNHSALQITVQPRPRFPPPLLKLLLPHTTTPPPHLPHLPLSFPISLHSILISILTPYNLPISIPPSLFPCFTSPSIPSPHSSLISSSLSPLPWSHLHPFQRSAIVRAISSLHGRLLLADDMGLGKTLQALCIAHYYHINSPSAPPVLILCPATLRPTWTTAIHKWLTVPPLSVHNVTSVAQFRRLSRAYGAPERDAWDSVCEVRYVVMAYDLLIKVVEEGIHVGFEIVVADECHLLRNIAAARTKAAVGVLCGAARRVLISGTPIMSRPAELFPLLKCLLEREGLPFLTYDEFCGRYCSDGKKRVCYATELNALLSMVMIRRTKGEVGGKLPRKVRRHVTVEIEADLLEPLKKMREELEELGEVRRGLNEGEGMVTWRRHQALCQSLRFLTAVVKIPVVVTRVKQLLKGGVKKMLVFAHHLNLLDAVESFVKRENVEYVRMDGATVVAKRAGLVEAFQTDQGVRVGILSLRTAGTGLTLTAADVVLFAELSWVPADLVQAEDRAHRIGRVGEVIIEYVVAAGTVDDLMWSVVQSKLGMVNATVDGLSKGRREALDVSVQSAKRVKISQGDVQEMRTEAVKAAEDSEYEAAAADGEKRGL